MSSAFYPGDIVPHRRSYNSMQEWADAVEVYLTRVRGPDLIGFGPWIDVGPLLQNSWIIWPSVGHADFRLVTMGPKRFVQFAGGILSPFGTTTSGTLLFTLPTNMVPVQKEFFFPGINTVADFGSFSCEVNRQVIYRGPNVTGGTAGCCLWAAGLLEVE